MPPMAMRCPLHSSPTPFQSKKRDPYLLFFCHPVGSCDPSNCPYLQLSPSSVRVKLSRGSVPWGMGMGAEYRQECPLPHPPTIPPHARRHSLRRSGPSYIRQGGVIRPARSMSTAAVWIPPRALTIGSSPTGTIGLPDPLCLLRRRPGPVYRALLRSCVDPSAPGAWSPNIPSRK